MTDPRDHPCSLALRHSPLEPCHREMGAVLGEFAGWRLSLRFAGEVLEHRAVRESAGLFDISHMGQLSVTGPDAAAALAFALVSDVSLLAPRAARYTMLCNAAGGVLDDLIVYRRGESDYFVVANAANTGVVIAELVARSAGREVVVDDETAARALISIQGPRAEEALSRHLAAHDTLPARFHLTTVSVAGRSALVARTGYTGEDGFEISVASADGEHAWRALLGDDAVVAAGLAARDSLRLEAGLPLYGHELDTWHSPLDANLGRIIDFSHDFVGREALQRPQSATRPTLVGLVCDSQRSPRPGYSVHRANGDAVGVITSGGPSIMLGRAIAMGYVDPAVATPETPLLVDIRGRREPATVVRLPFVHRARGGGGTAPPVAQESH